jgi:uncharacterized protein (DUF433 family)
MDISAFTTDHVRRLTGLSTRQIRYWDQTGFFSPTEVQFGRMAFRRVYTFRDVVGLRTIALLRKQLPLQELRRVGEWLRARWDAPWSSLRLGLANRKIAYFDTDAGIFRRADDTEQGIVEITIEPIAQSMDREAAKLRERQPDDLGRLVRNRYVVHNSWVVAGTRIPVRAIVDMHDSGYTNDAILREFPRLTKDDIEAAIRHTQKRAA